MSYGDPAPEQETTDGGALAGDQDPTSNDGTMGADAPAGDAGLTEEGDDNTVDMEDLP